MERPKPQLAIGLFLSQQQAFINQRGDRIQKLDLIGVRLATITDGFCRFKCESAFKHGKPAKYFFLDIV